jgi:hypothetical protein
VGHWSGHLLSCELTQENRATVVKTQVSQLRFKSLGLEFPLSTSINSQLSSSSEGTFRIGAKEESSDERPPSTSSHRGKPPRSTKQLLPRISSVRDSNYEENPRVGGTLCPNETL